MSNSNLFLNAVFPRAPLANGIGRYVCQLQRVTLKFCKNQGNSRGMRDFLEHDLINFANESPGVVVYVKPRRHRVPVISAEYLNGEKYWICCKDHSRDEVRKWMELLRTQHSNTTDTRLRKMSRTEFPSIQGPWTPFTFKDPTLNLAQFPDKELGAAVKKHKTATEQLIEIYKEQQKQKNSEN